MITHFASEDLGTCSTTAMPITTRTVAKGIPPRLHEPKRMAKATKTVTSKPQKSGKWAASESESESESDESEPVKKKTKCTKRQRVNVGPDVEVELVEEGAEPPEKEVEEVDAGSNDGQDSDKEEVSKHSWAICKNLRVPRRMTSMNTNADMTSKNGL